MFERDKEDLRELGVPVVSGPVSAWFEDETGYRIDRDAYALPPVDFDPEELAVLGLASRVWQQASLAGPAARALAKLSALGVEPDESSLVGVEPRVRTAEPAFDPLFAATRVRAPVTFTYRRGDGEAGRREVEPWAVVSRGGHWYLVGRDRDRHAARVFRLSRIESNVDRIGQPGSYSVPEGLDPQVMVAAPTHPADERPARLRVRPGRGGALRRRARLRVEGQDAVTDQGWEVLVVPIGDVSALADEVAGYGPDVVVLDPPDLRTGVVRRLEGALSAQTAEPAEPAERPA
jgi:proteasome accessory factor B